MSNTKLTTQPTGEAEIDSEKNAEVKLEIEKEIECPRCYNVMTLCSDFDRLYYSCEECDFCLYTLNKN